MRLASVQVPFPLASLAVWDHVKDPLPAWDRFTRQCWAYLGGPPWTDTALRQRGFQAYPLDFRLSADLGLDPFYLTQGRLFLDYQRQRAYVVGTPAPRPRPTQPRREWLPACELVG